MNMFLKSVSENFLMASFLDCLLLENMEDIFHNMKREIYFT